MSFWSHNFHWNPISEMPDETENTICSDLDNVLENLEHYSLRNNLHRTEDYNTVFTILENNEELNLRNAVRLLKICVHDLEKDMRYATNIMKIIPVIISKVKMGQYDPCPDLLPSALAIIHVLKMAALLTKVESLQQLCFSTLISYPNDTLIAVAEQHEELMEIFNLYCHMRMPVKIRLQPLLLLEKLLKILTEDKRTNFVEKGLSVWFSKIIPTCLYVEGPEHEKSVELLEHLTEALLPIDYTANESWHYMLECICCTKKYPAVMKALLQKGSNVWHRLWIVIIKLLKHQVTQPLDNIGTPINSMLPVVEAAFKVDVANRCKAFECWNVLIDSFSTETNESNIYKRIKLLIIPLRSNNAKAVATAVAKFNCWWHLIQKFQCKIDKYIDPILVSFLHFCFGRHNATDNNQSSVLIPGQLSMSLKQQCIQALVEIVGHVDCNGCTDLPKLNGKLINTKNLVDNWNHWVFSLTSAIMMSASSDNGLSKQQMTCLWKSYLMTIGELPENNIRKDLFSEMLSILSLLVKECKSNARLADLVLNALILPLFNGDIKIKELLKTKSSPDSSPPLRTILRVLLDPALHLAYQSCSFKEMVTKLKVITDTLLDPVYCPTACGVDFVLKHLTKTDISLTLWTALAESVYVSQGYNCVKTLVEIIVWPLQHSLTAFTHVKTAAMTWYNLYDLFNSKLKKVDVFEKAMSTYLYTSLEFADSAIYFKVCVTLCVLKHKLREDSRVKCERDLELLYILTGRMDNYHSYEQLFPLMVDTVVSTISVIVSSINEHAARYTLFSIKKMLKLMTLTCKQPNASTDVSHVLTLISSLLKALDVLMQVEAYKGFIPIIVEEVTDCSSYLSQQSLTKNIILSVMKTLKSKVIETDVTSNKTNTIIDIENETSPDDNQSSDQNSDKNKFTTPNTKGVPKKAKKKEPSIVNTVVENGEEYVVVKSNWKFNPRKLTEHQKEKLQQKREDIPALYQDLSQSQDEFKLASWKPDSQDTSSSSKSESKSCKSGNNETATEILSNLPSSDVVPKILESFFADNAKKDSPTTTKDASAVNKVKKMVPVTPKTSKSPRMALKDRVFRNVRNLIENSTGHKENKDASEDLNKTDGILKTPKVQSKSDSTSNIVNSAPPLLSADRPSRVKRKPKKFDELLLLDAKKRRQSMQDSKSKCQSKQSDLYITPSETVTTEDANVSDEENELNDLQVSQNQNISGVNEVIQSKEILHEDESDIKNKKDKVDDIETEMEMEEKNTRLDLETNMDIDTNNEMLNKQKAESSNEKKIDSTTQEKLGNSSKKTVESSTEKKVENSANNKNECSNSKKRETCNAIKDQKSNKEPEKSNPIKEQILTDNKDKSSNEKNKKAENLNNKKDENLSEKLTDLSTKEAKRPSTPQQESKNKETEDQKSTTKKTVRKSRIEKELAIDMVEGHPFLKMQSKRLTRNALESVSTGRRKNLVEKLHKSKSEAKKTKEKNKDSDCSSSNSSLTDSQGQDTEIKDQTSFTEDLPYSDDVIESSQDSSITTISVKSTKKATKKIPIVSIEKLKLFPDEAYKINESQSILDCGVAGVSESAKANQESKDDSELPLNKTASEGQSQADLTENMDTEPIEGKDLSDVVVIVDDVPAPLTISSDETEVGQETQEIAEADTQPTDPNNFMEVDVVHKNTDTSLTVVDISTGATCTNIKRKSPNTDKSISENQVNPPEDVTITLSDSAIVELEKENGASSPSSFGDEDKRKQDFLNNTLEISPIKNMSPERNKKSPSPDSSSDYVVITLSSPVNSNGEPFEKCGSPEVFTEDKVSPDKRDQSPPRVEVTVTNTSPSSLSLKKIRPQVRAVGRAAQMLGLCCVPDPVQGIVNQEKGETEEIKKSTSGTPARRNLRVLYNTESESEPPNENEDSEHFLKFRRSLPAVDSSPAGPILKRKLAEIVDDSTMSPASKRKRVSFHDPPVSTTVSVQKYIESGAIRSPQNSANKRLERQMRQNTPLKSPKRLDHVFKLDTVLNKAVESFTETSVISTPDDTQPFSLDETPVVEIVRASELNDTDPICPDLVDCKDPIDNIAGELSSFAMKSLLVKELVGKVETVGDLAKMTELEVNRLCIKAPKVKVAKKVLTDYASKRVEKPPCDVMVSIDEAFFNESMPEPDLKQFVDNTVQTFTECVDMEIQTLATTTSAIFVQTETTPTVHTVVQTDESGSKSTADIVKTCLAERPDFVEQVSVHLEDSSIQHITDKLPFSDITDVLMKKITPSDAKTLMNRVLEDQWNNTTDENRSSKELSFIREYMSDRFDSKDLILFCSEILKSVYEKPAIP